MLPKSKSWCLLDSEGYVSLGSILATYDAPINEEHAWALCVLSAKYLETHSLLLSNASSLQYTGHLKPTEHRDGLIKIHHLDGSVCLDVIPVPYSQKNSRTSHTGHAEKARTKSQLLSNIALSIYQALDYGLKEDEERDLSTALENVLDGMAACEESTLGCEKTVVFAENEIIKASLDHFGLENDVDAVCFAQKLCKTLVSDTLEVSKFLSVVERASETLACFRNYTDNRCNKTKCEEPDPNYNLSLKAVAKIWIHVVRELRCGVKLKTSSNSTFQKRDHYECVKTPYELLMDDIRSQKYKLKKAPDRIPRRKTDTLDLHEVIMTYIRSRPKLRNASERILKPVASQRNDPYEKLMQSIRQEHRLRPVPSKTTI